MTQGAPAPDFGVVVPTLAAGVSCLPGSPIAIEDVAGSGLAYLANKHTGNTPAIGLANRAGSGGEAVPVTTLGLVTLTEAEWNAVALDGGSASTTGLVPGAVYGMYTSGLLNTGNGAFSVGDLLWNVGIAISNITMMVAPFAVYKAN